MKRYVAEAIGTYGLVLFGTGSVVVNSFSDGAVGLVGIALSFGLVVATMIYAIGDLSGAHINPAVTIGAVVAKRFPAKDAIPYILAQCLGGLLASATLAGIFPMMLSGDNPPGLGATLPATGIGVPQAFLFEVILTFFLMFVILGVTAAGKAEVVLAGFAIGGVVAFEVFVGGPITGGSMNPARSLGPAVIGGQMQHLWLYLVAPIVGAVLAALVTNFLRSEHTAETDDTPVEGTT